MKHTISYLATRAALASRAAFAAGASRAFAAGALLTLAAGLTGCADEPTANPDGARQELRLVGVIDGAATPKAASQAATRAADDSENNTDGENLFCIWVQDAGTKADLYAGYRMGYELSKLTVYEPEKDANGADVAVQLYFPKSGNDVEISTMSDVSLGTPEDWSNLDLKNETQAEKYARLNMPNGEIPFYLFSRGIYRSAVGDENYDSMINQVGINGVDLMCYSCSDLLYARQRAARTNDDVELKFYHMLSKIELQVTFGDGVKEYDLLGVTLDDALCRGTFSPSKITDITSRTDRAAAIAATPGSEATIDLWQDTADTKRYRFIVVPQEVAGKTLTFTMLNADDLVYTFPAAAEFESGLRHVYKVTLQRTGVTAEASIHPWNSTETADGDASLTLPAAKVGDYYYSDGSYSTELQPTKTVIGIVFCTDPARIGQAEKDALAELGVATPHGLVVATKAAGDNAQFAWYAGADGDYERDESEIGIPNIMVTADGAVTTDLWSVDKVASFNLADADINGYAHNVAIQTQRATDYNNTSLNGGLGAYPAFKVAETFGVTVPPPSKTTGWYLPSVGQWLDIVRGICGVTLSSDGDLYTNQSSGSEFLFWLNKGNVSALLNAAMAKIPDAQKNEYVNDATYPCTSSAANPKHGLSLGFSYSYMNVSFYALHKNLSWFNIRPILAF